MCLMLQDDVMNLEKRLDHIKWQSDVIKKNTEDMDASAAIMTKVQHTTEKIVKTLTLVLILVHSYCDKLYLYWF